MSEPQTALQGATAQGFVTVSEDGLHGMISLRGDLNDPKLKAAVAKLTGAEVPTAGRISWKGDRGVAWMSPDELLVIGPYSSAGKDALVFSKALKGVHHLVANVSDARAVFRIEGAGFREVLAKLTPADVSMDAFGIGQIRRSRFAQVAGACWMLEEGSARVVCFRSVAGYIFGLLEHAARSGSEVGYV
jgi:sarcosine oxidase subunit gamma